MNDEDDNLRRINDELLKRRAAAKAEAMMQYGDTFSAIKKHLAQGKYDLARQLSVGLSDTQLFREIAELFQKHPEIFHCEACGKVTDPIAFKRESLTWIRPHVCDDCEKKERQMKMERQSRYFAKFIQQNMDKILEVVGISGRLLSGSYEGLPSTIVETCKRAVMGKHGLYFYGEVGTGKSCLAVAVLKDVMQTTKYSPEMQRDLMRDIAEFRKLYCLVPVAKLLGDMRASYGNKDFQAVEILIEKYSTLQVLILDDIGMEKPSAWVREKLNTIVDYRNNRELKTLYTSNKSTEKLMLHLDERLTSRIIQQCEIIHLTGPDRRRQDSTTEQSA
jgi:DNA replication protein DnaC